MHWIPVAVLVYVCVCMSVDCACVRVFALGIEISSAPKYWIVTEVNQLVIVRPFPWDGPRRRRYEVDDRVKESIRYGYGWRGCGSVCWMPLSISQDVCPPACAHANQ